MSLESLHATITDRLGRLERPVNRPLLIGVDGCGGSGKSTLAEALKASCPSPVTIVHLDDFYVPPAELDRSRPESLPVGADFDWRRLKREVLDSVLGGADGKYQRYDWGTERLSDWHEVPACGTLIVEGVTSTRLELAPLYDLTIWVDCPREERLRRGLERDGEEARGRWAAWMAAEDRYAQSHKPMERADLVVEGV
ncbi:uridine kinase [Paenibacillus sp. D9]|uniref:uridine kinase family protein n=1 Tax=Paenibacillus TaxID=44249 RepID=UPI00061F3B93|nr:MULTISPECIES: AAA family ATPase [Paenibacillus]KKC48949.1 uridine kinase [Paenibacillus sp. D9]